MCGELVYGIKDEYIEYDYNLSKRKSMVGKKMANNQMTADTKITNGSNHYEVQLLLNHALSNDQVTEAIAKLSKFIEENQGQILKKEMGDLQVLKYKINKNNVARYIYLGITLPTDKIAAMRYEMRLSADIIRYIVINVETESQFTPASFAVVNEKDYRNRTMEYWFENATYKNPNILRLFTTERGKILTSRLVENYIRKYDPKFMRQLSQEIKRARTMAWLPM